MPVTITTINTGDQITNSRAVINTNFTNTKNAVETLEGTVTTIGSDLNTLEDTVGGLETTVSTLSDTVAGLSDPSVYMALNTSVPATNTLTWINQGGASVTEYANFGFVLMVPASSENNIRGVCSSLTASGYAMTAGTITNIHTTNYSGTGIIMRNTTTGNIMLYGVGNDGVLAVSRWNGLASFSQVMSSITIQGIGKPIFLRVTDGTGSRVYSYSFDGRVFIDMFSEANNAWIGAPGAGANNQIGVFVNVNNISTAPGYISIFHYELAAL